MSKLKIKNSKNIDSVAVTDESTHLKNESNHEQNDVDYTQLTNNDLARIIIERGYSTRAESTLSRLSKDELLLIIANKSDDVKGDAYKTNIESAHEIVKIIIDLMDEIKQAREQKQNNQTLKNFTQKQSISLATYLNGINANNYGLIALIIGLLIICIDSIIGFANLKKVFIKNGKNK